MPAAPRHHGDKPFVIRRTLAAARERVWRAWTDADDLQRWFGPKGCTMPVCRLDLRPGGTLHYCLRTTEFPKVWGKWTFREIVAPQRLVLIQCFSDAQGGITRHPMAPTWPLQTLATTTFTELAGATTVEVSCLAYDATAEEHQAFDGAHASMEQGWGGTFDQLRDYLARG